MESGTHKGQMKYPGQGNNFYVFPGIGLGSLAVGASRVSDQMLLAAVKALEAALTQDHKDNAMLYPPVSDIRALTLAVATEVGLQAIEEGHARAVAQIPLDRHGLTEFLRHRFWTPNF